MHIKQPFLLNVVQKGFAMNTDGTTKGQRKLGGLALNNMTISVNKLSDGSADQVIADISKESKTPPEINLESNAQLFWIRLLTTCNTCIF